MKNKCLEIFNLSLENSYANGKLAPEAGLSGRNFPLRSDLSPVYTQINSVQILAWCWLLLLIGQLCACSSARMPVQAYSPDGKIMVAIELDEEGAPFYSIYYEDSLVVEPSSLGLQVDSTGLAKGLKVISTGKEERVSDQYTLLSGKRSHCVYEANRRLVRFSEASGIQLSVIFQVSNDGVAFRYLVEGPGSEVRHILAESTTFNFPASAKAWLHPHAVAQSGWEHTQPSYEENYSMEIKVGTPSPLGQGWSFPALFQSAGHWVLVSETDMVRNYCGSHLGHLSPEGEYAIAFPQAPERMGPEAPLFPESTLPIQSPWRVIAIGKSLGPIVESTLSTDLSTPSKIAGPSFAKPGKAAWSWVLLKDDSTVFQVQKRFIDYAAGMNWEYCLIDAHWDTQIGYEKIEELANYAQTKNVGLILWYNSNGSWNTAPLTPKDRVTDPKTRKEEFSRIKEMGIKGLKIDFFGGDGQSFMNYYQDLIEDAAAFGFIVNFHGATIPRGWERTYPNLVTMESVKGFEFITFEQANADAAPAHCAMLPFARNAVGPMDFTPVCFSEVPNIERRTTNGFELALSVLFQSGVQHYAEVPEGMAKQPGYVVGFLRGLPSRWDDIKFIDGYPGKYAVIARKAEGRWYVAGINGTEAEVKSIFDLSLLGNLAGGTLITDGETSREFSKKEIGGSKIEVVMKPHGGFVFVPL